MLSRRRFLASAAGGGALALAQPLLGRLAIARASSSPLGVRFDPAPFQLGVASGDPLPDSVILWTRLTAEPLDGGGLTGPVPVEWTVATDPAMRAVIAGGTELAQPGLGHALHVDVRGLAPSTVYFYRFRAGGVSSRVGRAKTAPDPSVPTPSVKFGFCSCNGFADGRFAAFAHMAAERLDFIVHLGDYMYEYEGGGEDGSRDHTGGKTLTLEDYRNRYALYKGDPQLRAAHASCPWIMTWDDHEVEDNYAGVHSHSAQAYALKTTGPTPAFVRQRAAAYQAWYENTPIRVPSGPPAGADLRIFRHLAFGDLLDVVVLDTRQYRDPQVSPELPAAHPGIDSKQRTILGAAQRDWLLHRIAASNAAWLCLANQVQLAPTRLAGLDDDLAAVLRDANAPIATTLGLNADSWDGYQHDRRILHHGLVKAGRVDTVVLTGDIHSFGTHDLKTDYGDPTSPTIGAEFVGGSITSGGPGQRGTNEAVTAALAATNPHTRYVEYEHRGYGVCHVTRERWTTAYRMLDDVTDEKSPITTAARFIVERGRPGVRRAN